MPNIDSQLARQHAVRVVTTLREAGYEAYWAGGCVRDQLLGRTAKDYDVATSATPEQIRSTFGHRRTLAMGVAFGVITVLGPHGAGQVEVATFRRDLGYSDGRRPDAVVFSSAAEDARRRDFTMNGLFLDPLTNEVHDFVNGQADLQLGIVRAIGNAHERFREDKLRLLRAVRFAATFRFQIEPATLTAVQQHASDIHQVSAERIAAELRRMLVHHDRAHALELLAETHLLPHILPEVEAHRTANGDSWQHTLRILRGLQEPSFGAALAALLYETVREYPVERRALLVETISQRWKLANDERDRAAWLLMHEPVVRAASHAPWPRLQRVLVHAGIDDLLALTRAIATVHDGHQREIDFCEERLQWPPERLNPPPLITGRDLLAAGFVAGPAFKAWLEAIRDAQLERQISTRDEALALAQELAAAT